MDALQEPDARILKEETMIGIYLNKNYLKDSHQLVCVCIRILFWKVETF